MKKNYCDLCKKEIGDVYCNVSFYKSVIKDPFKEFDLCDNCYKKLIKAIEQLKK